MTHPLSNELVQALAHIGQQVDDLNPLDLKTLALALQAERARIRGEIAGVQRQMHEQRSQAVAHFTQLMLCARQDLPLAHSNYFDAAPQLRELSHE